jgi:hypothetical protein
MALSIAASKRSFQRILWTRRRFRGIKGKKTAIRADYYSNPNRLLGAAEQNRTVDTRIFSPLLYRLSYSGADGTFIADPSGPVNQNDPKTEALTDTVARRALTARERGCYY